MKKIAKAIRAHLPGDDCPAVPLILVVRKTKVPFSGIMVSGGQISRGKPEPKMPQKRTTRRLELFDQRAVALSPHPARLTG